MSRERKQHDLVVIGGGPGGYVAAIRAAQLGLDVAVVEARRRMGGTCLNVGCIPSKALLESSHRYEQAREELHDHGIAVDGVRLDLTAMMRRKDEVVGRVTQGVSALLWKWKVKTYTGRARLLAPGRLVLEAAEASAAVIAGAGDAAGQPVEGTEIEARRILIATGSLPAALPGIALDGERIVSSTEALAWTSVPEHLVVIGAGAIGLELGSVWRRLGARVTVLETLDRILPGMDGEIAGEARAALEQQGLEIHTGQRVEGVRAEDEGRIVEIAGREAVRCSHILLAVGRRPNTEGLNLEAAGVVVDPRGRIVVDERFRTSSEGFYAIGDVIAGPMLAHKAADEGVACVEAIVTGHGRVNYETIPAIVYTWPEVASVGATEEDLRERGVPLRKGTFPFLANGRAHALGEIRGQVKILAHAESDRILGVHIFGPHAGDLIAEAAVAIEFGASSEDLARTCHAHPTLAEAVREAALAVDRRAIHI